MIGTDLVLSEDEEKDDEESITIIGDSQGVSSARGVDELIAEFDEAEMNDAESMTAAQRKAIEERDDSGIDFIEGEDEVRKYTFLITMFFNFVEEELLNPVLFGFPADIDDKQRMIAANIDEATGRQFRRGANSWKNHLKVWVSQYERGAQDGTLHAHVYLKFDKKYPTTFKRIRDLFQPEILSGGRVWKKQGCRVTTARRESDAQMKAGVCYCSKNLTRVKGCNLPLFPRVKAKR